MRADEEGDLHLRRAGVGLVGAMLADGVLLGHGSSRSMGDHAPARSARGITPQPEPRRTAPGYAHPRPRRRTRPSARPDNGACGRDAVGDATSAA